MMQLSERTRHAVRVTGVGLITNAVLIVFKFTAGILGRSGAMLADAVHSFTDLATDILVLWGLRMVEKPADSDHAYGHGKVETLIASVVGAALFFVGIRIFWTGMTAVLRTVRGTFLPRPGWIAFYAAVASLLVKEWLYRYTIKTGKDINSQAMIANAWHHRSDSLSSLGVVVGIGGAITLGEKWHILDPCAAVAVSFFIAKAAVEISVKNINDLLEASLPEDIKEEILRVITAVPGVKNPHNMKTRRIGSGIAIDIHIEVEKTLNIVQAHEISTRVEKRLRERFGTDTFVSVHEEPVGQRHHGQRRKR